MPAPTAASRQIRERLGACHAEVDAVLARYAATNCRIFGSVARGDARPGSDLDLLVDLVPDAGNELMRVAGLAEELSDILGVHVDVVAPPLLRPGVSATALADAVPA